MVKLYPYEERKNFKLLIQCLKKYKDNCIFWIGAGISKIAGYPSWKELVLEVLLFFEENKHTLSFEKMMEFKQRLYLLNKKLKKGKIFADLFQELKRKSSYEVLEIFKTLDFKDFPDILQWLKYIDNHLYIKGVQQLFKDKEKQQKNEIYLKIGKFLSKGIPVITTNIDKGLEIALSISEDEISIVSLGRYNLNSKIFYLHGRIDEPKSWILSEQEYGERYANSKEFLNFWEEFLERFNDPWLPGKHVPFDPLAAMLCKKQKMKTYITNVEGFIKWIKEDKFVGTILY